MLHVLQAGFCRGTSEQSLREECWNLLIFQEATEGSRLELSQWRGTSEQSRVQCWNLWSEEEATAAGGSRPQLPRGDVIGQESHSLCCWFLLFNYFLHFIELHYITLLLTFYWPREYKPLLLFSPFPSLLPAIHCHHPTITSNNLNAEAVQIF